MKRQYKILAVTSIPIIITISTASIGLYIILLQSKQHISDFSNLLYLIQINHIYNITATLSTQISREAQKSTSYSFIINNFVTKVFNGIVHTQPLHINSLINFDLLQQNKEDPILIQLAQKDPNLVNNWQSNYYFYMKDLDEQTKYNMLNIYKYSTLQRSFQQENNLSQNDRKIVLDNIFYATEKQGLIINSRNNTIFDNFLSEKCSKENDKSSYPYCQSWFQDTYNNNQMQYNAPQIINTTNSSQIVQLQCLNLQDYIQLSHIENDKAILCIEAIITQFRNYFKNLGNYTQQVYFFDTSSQIILYQSDKSINQSRLNHLFEQDLPLFGQSQTQSLNQSIQNFISNLTCFQNLNKLDQQIYYCQKCVNLNNNNTSYSILISPIIITSQNYASNNKIYVNNFEKNIQIPYLIISFLTEDNFRSWEQDLDSSLVMSLRIFGGCLIILIIPLSLIVYAYLLSHFIVIDDQMDHLIYVLKEMATHKYDKDIVSSNIEDQFFSYETKQLYSSFQAVYQILIYTSENIFEINDTETLIKLSNNLKFFKEFGNIHAEGITYNNIATLLMAKGHLFESVEYFTQSIVCARYEIQQFCKENPFTFSAFSISEFGYSTDMQEIIQGTSNRNTENSSKQKKLSSIFRLGSQKTENNSATKLKKEGTVLSQQSGQIEQKQLEKYKQYNQFLLQNNQFDQMNYFEDDEEIKEQRIFLMQNFFSRNRNLIISLLLINAFYKGKQNYWKEIIELLNLLTKVCEQLPQRDLLLYEVLTVRYKSLSELKKLRKQNLVERQIENIISANQQQKEQLFQNNILKNSKNQLEVPNQIKLVQDSTTSFLNQNSSLFRQSVVQKSQFIFSEKKKTTIIQKSINLNKIDETSKEISQQFISQNGSIYQFILKLNDTKKIFLQNKQQNNGVLKINFQENDYRNYFFNKVSEIIFYSKQFQNLELLFEFRRKLDLAAQDYHLFNKYYSLENLETIFTVFKSQFLATTGQFRQAAEILTSLFENKKQIMSHYSFKISIVLKEIFTRSKIQSKEFNQLFSKFDNNLSMQIAMIFDSHQTSDLNFQQIQLFSNLINQVLSWERDQFGIIITNRCQNIVETFMPFMKIQQIKSAQNQIIKKILSTLNGDINLLFDELSEKIYSDIQLFDDQNKQCNDKISFTNQFSFTQQNPQSPLALKNYALDSIREERLLVSQEYDHSQISQISEEPIFKKSNLRGFNQINSCSYFTNFRENNQIHRSIIQNFCRNPQKQNFTPKIQSNQGDQSMIQTESIISDDKELAIQIDEFANEHFFHLSIHKALSSLFANQVKQEQINQKIQNRYGIRLNCQQNRQLRYIIYCTKQLNLKKNYLFLKLCQILSTLNIQVILLLQFIGSSFIEKQPDQTYVYNQVEVFRVFYHDQQIINFLKNQRNKVNFYSFSTQIQHY